MALHRDISSGLGLLEEGEEEAEDVTTPAGDPQDIGRAATNTGPEKPAQKTTAPRKKAPERPHACPSCDKAYTRRGDLTRHVNAKHPTPKPTVVPEPDEDEIAAVVADAVPDDAPTGPVDQRVRIRPDLADRVDAILTTQGRGRGRGALVSRMVEHVGRLVADAVDAAVAAATTDSTVDLSEVLTAGSGTVGPDGRPVEGGNVRVRVADPQWPIIADTVHRHTGVTASPPIAVERLVTQIVWEWLERYEKAALERAAELASK